MIFSSIINNHPGKPRTMGYFIQSIWWFLKIGLPPAIILLIIIKKKKPTNNHFPSYLRIVNPYNFGGSQFQETTRNHQGIMSWHQLMTSTDPPRVPMGPHGSPGPPRCSGGTELSTGSGTAKSGVASSSAARRSLRRACDVARETQGVQGVEVVFILISYLNYSYSCYLIPFNTQINTAINI